MGWVGCSCPSHSFLWFLLPQIFELPVTLYIYPFLSCVSVDRDLLRDGFGRPFFIVFLPFRKKSVRNKKNKIFYKHFIKSCVLYIGYWVGCSQTLSHYQLNGNDSGTIFPMFSKHPPSRNIRIYLVKRGETTPVTFSIPTPFFHVSQM